MMRTAIAAVVAIVGIALSIYFGVVVMFVGGVEQVIDEINADTVDGGNIAWGVLRIFYASAAAILGIYISGFLAFLIRGRG